MQFDRQKFLLFTLFVFLVFSTFGCAAPKQYLAHPEFEARSKNIKTALLIPPDIKVYERSTGGVTEQMDDWSKTGKENIQKALVQEFKEKSIELKVLMTDKGNEEIEDIQALYRAVYSSLIMRNYKKEKDFDYSLGSVEPILKDNGADALIIAIGSDVIATAGKKATSAVSGIVLASMGIYGVVDTGSTIISIAIVDPSGAILWQKDFLRVKTIGGYDLRKTEDAATIVKNVLSDFKGMGK